MATLNGTRALPRAIRRAQWQTPRVSRRRAATTTVVDYNEPEPYAPESLPLQQPIRSSRKQSIHEAKPFSEFLTDTFHRQHDYLRISVTERCNLRCLYCMPEEGIELSPNKSLLTSAEIVYLSALFVNQGVNKIRLTGGEPTVRKDIVPLMQQIGSLRRNGLKELALTTNAISLHRKLDAMVEAGLTGVNISLDTLDPFEFQLLTRRQGFDAVMKSINRIQEMNELGAGVKLKINAVVMRGLNDHQIMPFVEKTRGEDIEVRFIEYMPFGGNKWSQKKMLPYSEMLDIIRKEYPNVAQLKGEKNDTSKTWQIPGFKGRIGFITSMTHNFCGTCNRLRITSDGNLKVCLHGDAEVSLRDLLRSDNSGEPMDEEAFEAVRQIELDRRKGDSLRFDGAEGWMSKEQQLLEVIGTAVKRKEEKHAGMGELENMKNRPMILIGEPQKSTPRHQIPRSSSQSLSRQGHTQPWSQIPLHFLHPATIGVSQIRYSSSDARDSQDASAQVTSEEEGSANKDEADPGFKLGFQSLRELFHQPEPRARYRRPRTPEVEQTPDTPPSTPHLEERLSHDSTSTADAALLRSSSKALNGNGRLAEADYRSSEVSATTGTAHARASHNNEADEVERVANAGKPGGNELGLRIFPASSTDNPTRKRSRYRPAVRKHVLNERQEIGLRIRRGRQMEPRKPWGLSPEDTKTIDSITDPGSTVQATNEQSAALSSARNAQDDERSPVQIGKTLTHVNLSGQARMVDVGSKPDTKRTAIATAYVSFSNHEPLRLIFENNNKKGDVLGVARVAGIMAAKRTSDLIPLCHPIAISKVEMDLSLVTPGSTSDHYKARGNGGVAIRALVQCTGQTGVEMEALTAVTGAAMTVYDMCKAVDRSMMIKGAQVVYKSGGKSGLHCLLLWALNMGRQFFEDRNIEVPATLAPTRDGDKDHGSKGRDKDQSQ